MHHPQIQPPLTAAGYSVLSLNENCCEFSWTKELDHIFSRKFLNIAWWPIFKIRQNRRMDSAFFRNCRQLPGFENLWKTIQKGSFAYNTLFLGISPFHPSVTHLADITTLALLLGDEFIDGICVTAGKPLIRQLVNSGVSDFYMRKKIKNTHAQLEYFFDLNDMLPAEVMQTINLKYEISYNTFYDLLQTLLQLINKGLAGLPFEKAQLVADKIASACNNSFDTYLHDVNCCPEQETTADTSQLLHFHDKKTRHMQRKLLELRCVLAGKEYLMRNVEAQSWLDILSVLQIYDDMQDVALDDGIQDNLVLCIARCHFPAEWKWFLANKQSLQSKSNALLLSLHMPCCIQACLQLISDKLKTMNWEQQKIIHYLLAKNWFIARKPAWRMNKDEEEIFAKQKKGNPELLKSLYQDIKEQMPHLSVESVKSYIIETCFHLVAVRKYILKKTGLSSAYRLRYNLLSMSAKIKAKIFDTVTKN